MATMTSVGSGGLHFEWDPGAVTAIEAALGQVAEIYELSSRVKGALSGELADHVKALVRALDYHQQRPSGRPLSPDDLYSPMVTTTDGYAYPEPLTSVTPETVLAWADGAQLFRGNDVVLARLSDLLWILKAQPRPDLHAREAQAAMRRLWARCELASVHRADALCRALDLANELRDATLVSDTASDLVSAVLETLGDEEWAPGVAVPMIEALCGLPEAAQPEGVDELITESRRRYADDPFILESLMLLEMQRASSDQQRRRRIALEVVEMWRDHAQRRGGLVGIAHLERALELATNEGLTDAANELRLLLQQPKSADELGMQRLSAEVTIPREAIEGFVTSFTDTSGPEETLARLASHLPITDVDADMHAVRDQMRQFPLQHLFSTVVTNTDGTPIVHITTDEQKFNYALNQHHTMAITVWGSLLGMIMERLAVGNKLAPADVQRFVVGDFIDDSMAEGIARSYEDIQNGDYEAALHRLLARAERAIRRVSRELGLAILREPSLDGKSLGAYKGLGELLRLFEGRMPEHQRRYLAVLLTERTGLNLRNRSAHGLMEAVSLEEAALALHAVLGISRWSVGASDASAELHP